MITNSSTRRCGIAIACLLMIMIVSQDVFGQTDRRKLDLLVQNSAATDAARIVREGRDLISDDKWEDALKKFDDVVRRYPNSTYTDAALYWRAYILKRQAKYTEADYSLQMLFERFPRSQWTQDAKAMQVEMAPQLGRSAQAAVEAAREEENDQIKIVALQSLFQANQERAMTFVYDILQQGSTSSPKIKEGAIKLLGRYHDPAGGERATRLLMDMAQSETNIKLRKIALYHLGRGEWSEHKFRFDGDDQIIPILENLALNATEREIATGAVEAINHIANHHDDPRIKTALIKIGTDAPARQVRQKAVSRIGEMAEKDGIKILPDLVSLYDANEDRELKKHIISVISRMENEEAQNQVVTFARSADHPELRKRAAYVIGQRGNETGVNALSDIYAAETSRDVKDQILHAFNETKHKAGLMQLMEIARSDTDLKMRMKAVNYLGRNKDPEAQKFLEMLLK